MSDYILLELHAGYPVLRINHGSGEIKLEIDGLNAQRVRQLEPLNDGEWHRIDIFRRGKLVRMVVDECIAAVIHENEMRQTSVQERMMCETQAETPGGSYYLNVNTPLELGGRSDPGYNFPVSVQRTGFHGCIKNLRHNGELYDLHIGRVGEQSASQDGCPEEQRNCGLNDVTGPVCGRKGECVGSLVSDDVQCICEPGWRGPQCSIASTTKDLQRNSFIEWDFTDDFYRSHIDSQRHMTQLQLMFRTRQASGLLLLAQNAHKSEYLKLEVRDTRLNFRYNLGRGEEFLSLSYVNVSDGQWHSAHVRRVGRWSTLALDSGGGRHFNETYGSDGGHAEIRVSQRNLIAGGNVRFSSSNAIVLVNEDLYKSCMKDVRYNGYWLPLDRSENNEAEIAEVMRIDGVMGGCDDMDECTSTFCPSPLMCVNLWRHSQCRCAEGQRRVESGAVCEDIDECLTDPCFYGSTCVNTLSSFYCSCAQGFIGPSCSSSAQESATVDVSLGALLIIVICAMGLLLIVLLFIIYSRRRKPDQYVLAVPDDDVRENVMHYDEEGMGEEDQNLYDMNRLKKPLEDPPAIRKPVPPAYSKINRKPLPSDAKPAELRKYINERVADVEFDPSLPPHDSVREYAYEGGGSDAGSLSSLESNSTEQAKDQDFDFLNKWGPRFSKLANMYGETSH